MNKTISLTGYEMFSLQVLYVGASAGFLYPSLLINSTTGPLWAPISVWALLAFSSCILYSRMLLKLRGKELVPIIVSSLGKPAAIMLLLPILLFVIAAITVMLRSFTELITMTLLPTTPLLFLNCMIFASSGLAAAGLMAIIRAAKVIFLLAVGMIVFLLLVGTSGSHWELGGPWFRMSADFFTDGDFYGGSFVWMGFTYIAMIAPFSIEQARLYQKGNMIALVLSVLMVACFIYIPVMTFGREMSSRLTFPFVSKMDSIYQYWIILENLTAIFLSSTMLCLLLVIALKLKALMSITTSIWPKVSIKWGLAVVTVIVYIAAELIPEWRDLEKWVFNSYFLRFYAMFVFPGITLAGLHFKQRKAGGA
ncbi:Spore germination protein [Paenibacillaceae bacterium GAS479]|nr:Spore germination protein [Paenibacillaceae bacterium GAS479]